MFETCKYSQASSQRQNSEGPIPLSCFKIYFRVCGLLQNVCQNAQPQFITVLETTFLTMAELLLVLPTHMK